MYYYVEVKGNRKNTADVKAPADMCRIMSRRGYRPISFQPIKGKTKTASRISQLANWTKVFALSGRSDVLIYQYPLDLSGLSILLLETYMRIKRGKVVLLVHDIDSIRGYFRAENNQRKEKLLKRADCIICHNDRMKLWLTENGVPDEKIIPLGVFDCLLTGEYVPPSDSPSIIIAGNLAKRKSPYLYQFLDMKKDYQVYLYGPNFEGTDDNDHCQFIGSFPPDELIHHLKGGFGLVWDGDSVEECSGLTGQYLRYNNPHKVSSYLASGLPVIIWDQAALSDYIVSNRLGFCVSSLHEVSQKLHELSYEEYRLMCRNAVKEGEKLRTGYYLNCALDNVENMLGRARKDKV